MANRTCSVNDADLMRRWWPKVRRSPSGCWTWVAGKDSKGYGSIKVHGRMVAAHRVAYELFAGPIPEGLQIDHLCRNPACVNPKHLEAVTPMENSRRGLNGVLKTHCPQGHPYDEENTRWHRGRNGKVWRRCHKCNIDRVR